MDWKKYERLVAEHLAMELPWASIEEDVRLQGFLSKRSRQLDIVVRNGTTGLLEIVVDAKHHARPIDVKHIEGFIGLLRDIRAPRGMLVSKAGYSAAALQRAFADDVDLDLEVFSLDELESWQGSLAIPYSGTRGVVLPAPLGWVVQGDPDGVALAILYQRGLGFEDAVKRVEFMYLQLWHRRDSVSTLNDLLEHQKQAMLAKVPGGGELVVEFPEWRPDEICALRRFESPLYPSTEITEFVEFDDFIPFVILFTPLELQRRNTRKLEYLIRNLAPMTIRHDP